MIIVSFQTIDYRLGKASREIWVFCSLAIGIHGILIFVHLIRKTAQPWKDRIATN